MQVQCIEQTRTKNKIASTFSLRYNFISFLPLLELLSVQGIELALEFHDLESDLALNVQLLVLATVLEQHIVCIQTLLDSRAGSLLVVVVIDRSTSFFRVLELKQQQHHLSVSLCDLREGYFAIGETGGWGGTAEENTKV